MKLEEEYEAKRAISPLSLPSGPSHFDGAKKNKQSDSLIAKAFDA